MTRVAMSVHAKELGAAGAHEPPRLSSGITRTVRSPESLVSFSVSELELDNTCGGVDASMHIRVLITHVALIIVTIRVNYQCSRHLTSTTQRPENVVAPDPQYGCMQSGLNRSCALNC